MKILVLGGEIVTSWGTNRLQFLIHFIIFKSWVHNLVYQMCRSSIHGEKIVNWNIVNMRISEGWQGENVIILYFLYHSFSVKNINIFVLSNPLKICWSFDTRRKKSGQNFCYWNVKNITRIGRISLKTKIILVFWI